MDFIEQLPPSDGFMAILVIVDRLSKQGVFILMHDTITSQGLAKLFVMLSQAPSFNMQQVTQGLGFTLPLIQ